MTQPVSAMTNRTGSEAKLFQHLSLFLEVGKRVLLIDSMTLEEAIERDAAQTEHLPQLDFGNTARAELFNRECLEGGRSN